MTDYKELIERLRTHALISSEWPSIYGWATKDCNQAADAIEELLQRVESVGNALIRKSDAIDALAYFDEVSPTGKTAQQVVADLPNVSEKPTGWTPVSERLPEENKTVIASTLYGVYPEAHYTKEYGWEWAYEAGMDYWRELKDVTAWMPLPEPYKEENG